MSTPKHFVSIRGQGTNAPSYSPSRDIVWLMPGLMFAVGQSLADGFLEPWLRSFAERHGVDGAALATSYYKMVEAVVHFQDARAEHVAEAVDEVGLFDASPAARLILFAKLGMATLSFAHHHMRGASASSVDYPILHNQLANLEQFAGMLVTAAREDRPR